MLAAGAAVPQIQQRRRQVGAARFDPGAQVVDALCAVGIQAVDGALHIEPIDVRDVEHRLLRLFAVAADIAAIPHRAAVAVGRAGQPDLPAVGSEKAGREENVAGRPAFVALKDEIVILQAVVAGDDRLEQRGVVRAALVDVRDEFLQLAAQRPAIDIGEVVDHAVAVMRRDAHVLRARDAVAAARAGV